jgi:hypothetical protein
LGSTVKKVSCTPFNGTPTDVQGPKYDDYSYQIDLPSFNGGLGDSRNTNKGADFSSAQA